MCIASIAFLSFSFWATFSPLSKEKKSQKKTHLNHFLNFPPLFLKGFSGMMAVERGKEKQLCIVSWSVTTNGTS